MLLNHNLRVEIIRNAMAVRFDKIAKDMIEEEHALCDRAYNHFVPPEMAAAIALLQNSQQGWFRNMVTVVTFEADYTTICLTTRGKARPMPYQGCFRVHTRTGGAAGAIAKELLAFKNKSDTYKEDRAKAEKQLWVLLKSVRTTESLKKVWPEGATLYSTPPLPQAISALPAVQVAELNKMLGIAA